MKRPPSILLIAVACLAACATELASAALTFDLRAVSGSQVTIHSPKSVAVTQSSVGGWVDFELWGVITGANSTAADESMLNFAGSMLSEQFGNGAVAGSMVNTGEIAPNDRRGVVAPFNYAGYLDGQLRNLDNDPDLEIGGRNPDGTIGGLIAGHTREPASYAGTNSVAEFLLYRFTLPIAGLNAQSLADITSVRFLLDVRPPSVLWFEDNQPVRIPDRTLNPGTSVLIHTAQTPEELAMIPEPSAWLLAVLGAGVTGWFAHRRRPCDS